MTVLSPAIADFVNGCLEAGGGLLVLNHCRAVLRDKQVKGVSILSTAIFSLWGAWNLYFYPSLHQWWSLAGGCIIFCANFAWVYLMLKYRNAGPPGKKIEIVDADRVQILRAALWLREESARADAKPSHLRRCMSAQANNILKAMNGVRP